MPVHWSPPTLHVQYTVARNHSIRSSLVRGRSTSGGHGDACTSGDDAAGRPDDHARLDAQRDSDDDDDSAHDHDSDGDDARRTGPGAAVDDDSRCARASAGRTARVGFRPRP